MTSNQLSNSEEDTRLLAQKITEQNAWPICLYGDLGAGKTVFVKGVAKALGLNPNKIKSPTFNYIKEYDNLTHCDFYRIEELDDILAEQLAEACEKGHVVIEWAERAEAYLPTPRTDVFFEYIDENKRRIKWKIQK